MIQGVFYLLLQGKDLKAGGRGGLYVIQRLDIYNRDQIHQGQNGDIFTSSAEYAKIIRDYAAMTDEERQKLRTTVSDTTRKYGEKEFTQAVVNVYERAIYEYCYRP